MMEEWYRLGCDSCGQTTEMCTNRMRAFKAAKRDGWTFPMVQSSLGPVRTKVHRCPLCSVRAKAAG
jgi:hypothetical protein